MSLATKVTTMSTTRTPVKVAPTKAAAPVNPLNEYGNLLEALTSVLDSLEKDYDYLVKGETSDVDIDKQLTSLKNVSKGLTKVMTSFDEPVVVDEPIIGGIGVKVYTPPATGGGSPGYEEFTVISKVASGKKIVVEYPQETEVSYKVDEKDHLWDTQEELSLRSNNLWGPVGTSGKQFKNYSIYFGPTAERMMDDIDAKLRQR